MLFNSYIKKIEMSLMDVINLVFEEIDEEGDILLNRPSYNSQNQQWDNLNC